jgi:D-alanine-D-alanine ligase
MPGTAGFIPVLHAATDSRPDEIDTIDAAESVAGALARLGYATEVIGLDHDLAGIDALVPLRPLLVFNLVDAVGGDCRLAPMVPARLDAIGLPYTGAGTNAWLDTLSKIGTKLKLARAGLPTPEWSADGTGLRPDARVIVKPVWEHGSLGIGPDAVVLGADAPRSIAERTLHWNTEHFAEGYIDGREFASAMMEGPDGVELLPIRETVFQGFDDGQPLITDYDAKWTPGSQPFNGTPRRFSLEREEPELAAELNRLAVACWDLFRIDGYARVDFRVDAAGAPFILEVNMNPCLSLDAGFAASAVEAGIAYDDMIARIVEDKLGRLQAIA